MNLFSGQITMTDMKDLKYFEKFVSATGETVSIYRTYTDNFSDGTTTRVLQRWNWDQENWSGHISDRDHTLRLIDTGLSLPTPVIGGEVKMSILRLASFRLKEILGTNQID